MPISCKRGLPIILLERIALMSDLATTMNLTYIVRSEWLARELLERNALYQHSDHLEALDPRALLWMMELDSFDLDSVRWEEIAHQASRWPKAAQITLLASSKLDWAFEDVLELGYLNQKWNLEAITSEKIESWLWHYAESCPEECADYDTRQKFAAAAIKAGAGKKWQSSEEDMRQEGQRLHHLVEMLFGSCS